MVVPPKNTKEENTTPQSRVPFFISVAFHVAVLIVIIVGLPHWKSEIDIVDPVPVELVANVSEMTTTNKPPVEAPKPPEPKPEEPPKAQEPPKPEVKKSEPPPPQEELKEPPKPEEKVEKIPEKKPEPKKPEKKPEPNKKPTPKKPEEKPKTQDDNSFESLLKDLTPEEKAQPDTPDTAPKTTTPTPSPASRFSDVLSISELDALRQQLSQCWSVMAGAQSAQDLQVEVQVSVNMDRTVSTAKIVDQSRYGSDTFFRAAADSALRALRNPLCTPLNLPPEKYDQWRSMTIVFDPKEMF